MKRYDKNYNDIPSARKDINYSDIRMSQFVIVMSQFVIVIGGFSMYFNDLLVRQTL